MAKYVANRAKQLPRIEHTLNRGAEKKRATESRRSARLEQKIRTSNGAEAKCFPLNPVGSNPESVIAPNCDRKRKRLDEHDDSNPSPLKRKSSRTGTVYKGKEVASIKAGSLARSQLTPIEHWRRTGRWPKEFFEQDEQTRKYLTRDLDEESWFEKYWVPDMQHLLVRKKSSSSLRGKQSEPGISTPTFTTPSGKKPREEKSAPYKDPRYETVLKNKGVFLTKYKNGVTSESNSQYRRLLETGNDVPKDSLFRDDLFDATCEEIQNRNEAKVIQDISRLIIPSARQLAIRGFDGLDILIEAVDEGWNNSIPVTKTRPQPDYAVGFRREAFTEEQLNKLQPFVGELTDSSYFMATWYMYFPFLTCEVKCGAAALDIADRQNAHSSTLAVRAVVELFKLVKREKELSQEILAFSMSHDHCSVRIYGHYAVIDGSNTSFYRHPIKKFDFTSEEGKDKWVAYKFTKNVYEIWMRDHFKRLCSVINQLPSDFSFELSHQSELDFQDTGLSQELQSYALSQSNADLVSLSGADSQASVFEGQDATPDTSLSQPPSSFKKAKKRAAEGG